MIHLLAAAPPDEGAGPLLMFLLLVGTAIIMGAVQLYDRLTGNDRWKDD